MLDMISCIILIIYTLTCVSYCGDTSWQFSWISGMSTSHNFTFLHLILHVCCLIFLYFLWSFLLCCCHIIKTLAVLHTGPIYLVCSLHWLCCQHGSTAVQSVHPSAAVHVVLQNTHDSVELTTVCRVGYFLIRGAVDVWPKIWTQQILNVKLSEGNITCGWWMPLGTGVQVPTDGHKSELQHLYYFKTTDNVEEETYTSFYTRIANCSLMSYFINTKCLSAIF
jgi:hypothetical protein